MTNKEAIEFLKNMIDREAIGFVCPEREGDVAIWQYHVEALQMAISALQAQDSPKPKAESVQNVPKEDLISRKAAIDAECEVCQIAPKKERGHNCTYYVHGCKEIECLRELPSAQQEIVRCGQCKYAEVADAQDNQDGYTCQFHRGSIWFSGSYCSWGERRTDEGD